MPYLRPTGNVPPKKKPLKAKPHKAMPSNAKAEPMSLEFKPLKLRLRQTTVKLAGTIALGTKSLKAAPPELPKAKSP